LSVSAPLIGVLQLVAMHSFNTRTSESSVPKQILNFSRPGFPLCSVNTGTERVALN
jgi:hypothetical protein